MILAPESTVAELKLYDCQVESSQSVSQINQYFKNNPNIPGVILLDKRGMIGMISQREFWQYMSRPYSEELCSRRSIKYLWDLLNITNLTIPKNTSIIEAVEIILARSSGCLEEPILIKVAPSQYRILDISQLLLACLKIHKQVNQLLVEANNSLNKNLQIDEVTGLGNELIFEEYFAREWEDLVKEKAWLSLVRFDLDFFEEYQNFYGD